MRRSRQIIVLCTSFLIGIVLAANYRFDIAPYLYTAFLLSSIAAIFMVKNKIGYIVFFGLGLVLGIWRYDIFLHQQLPSALTFENQKVSVVGTIDGEPRWDEYRNYVFYLSNGRIENKPVEGLVRIKAITGVAKEGQVVRANGKLKAGQGKAESYISYADVDIINTNQPAAVQIKNSFYKGLETTLPKETAAFMAGILIGARSALPKTYSDVLTALGLTHIVAVSGYNLTILVGFLNKHFAKNWRWGGLAGSLWIILGFVIISGASASILRAGIMSALFLLASYYGKRLNLLVCMALVAVAMVVLQPQSLLSDIGWQLSFLSLFGITILAPKLSQLLPSKPKLLNDILSVTLAAQIATAGLVVYKFGQISLLAPLSNLIVMPLIPGLMLLGFISSILGMILPGVAYLAFGKYVHNIIYILFDLLTYLSNFSIAKLEIKNVSIAVISFYYGVVIIFFMVLGKARNNSATDKNRDKIEKDNSMPRTSYLNEAQGTSEHRFES